MDSQGNYCLIIHYDEAAFAGLPLQRFEAALAAEGVPMSVSYPSLGDVAVFRTGNLGPRLRHLPVAQDWATLRLPRAEHAAASTVWLQHRLLLADEEAVLHVATAVERIKRHAGAIAGV
jgi:hypothetical protein